jgi:pantoate kinase
MTATADGHREHTPNDPARAFVPGHVTGFFSVHAHDDPRVAGSRGAGIALTEGVTVALRRAEETTVTLGGNEVEMDAVARTLDGLGVEARVAIDTPLPVSAGFGVSGGAALGAALAANTQFELAHTENELVGVAHAAEVEAGTGLGDVVAQARGGVPLRLEPGAPEQGTLDGIIAPRTRIEYVSFGGRATDEIIGGDVETLSEAGERALSSLLEEPTLPRVMALSREFSREADLLTPPVETAIDAVEETGGEAAMAMLGDTVISLGTGLTEAGYDPEICEIHPAGATLL